MNLCRRTFGLAVKRSKKPLFPSYVNPFYVKNEENDRALLMQFIQENSFGLVVYASDDSAGVPAAIHVPILKSSTIAEDELILKGHVALANRFWRCIPGAQEVASKLNVKLSEFQEAAIEKNKEILIVFNGPHAYISPISYLPSHKSVPTWNYTAVHLYGTPKAEMVEEDVLNELSNENEQHFQNFHGNEKIWSMHDSEMIGRDYIDQQIKGIVGFQVKLTRWQGRFKLSQNKNEQVQQQVRDQMSKESQKKLEEYMIQIGSKNEGRGKI
jgi:transcriptional regulator